MTDHLARARRALHASVRSALGAPRLFRAARRAGADRRGSLDVLGCSALVLFVVAPRAAGEPGRQNAVRHFVWQALITARQGEDVARAVAEAQEQGSTRPLDSAADRHNNRVGQDHGAARAGEPTPLLAASRTLLRVGLEKWRAGELS